MATLNTLLRQLREATEAGAKWQVTPLGFIRSTSQHWHDNPRLPQCPLEVLSSHHGFDTALMDVLEIDTRTHLAFVMAADKCEDHDEHLRRDILKACNLETEQ